MQLAMNHSYKLTAILFGIGVTVHNLEEAISFVGWTRSRLRLRFKLSPTIYGILTTLVSVAVWIPIIGVCVSNRSAPFTGALSGFALAMAINAVLPHLALSLATRSYCPGTATGLLLNLPLGISLIHTHLDSPDISHVKVWREALLYALLLALGSFGSLYAAHAISVARKT